MVLSYTSEFFVYLKFAFNWALCVLSGTSNEGERGKSIMFV